MASKTPTIPLSETYGDIAREVARVPLEMPARVPWLIALILSLALLSLFLASVTPQQACEAFARHRLAGRQGQNGKQGPVLLAIDRNCLALRTR